MSILGKIKAIKNPRQLIYKLYDQFHRVVPISIAKILSRQNNVGISNEILIKTYDGSGQAVHPSVTTFHDKEYLALTPYPYGRDFYENPCLYRKDKTGFLPIETCYPFLKPERCGYEHFSDPWIGNYGDKLVMVYRRCEREETGKIDQLFIVCSKDGEEWTSPELLIEAMGDQLISPAVCFERGELYCICVNEKHDTDVRCYSFESCKNINGGSKIYPVEGLGSDWFVWHIDVHFNLRNELEGCFMLQKKIDAEIVSKLGIFILDDDKWIWRKDVELNAEENEAIKFIYKSTFVDDTTLICSACDKKGRWFLFEKKL